MRGRGGGGEVAAWVVACRRVVHITGKGRVNRPTRTRGSWGKLGEAGLEIEALNPIASDIRCLGIDQALDLLTSGRFWSRP